MKNLNKTQRDWIISQFKRVGVNALSNDSVLQFKAKHEGHQELRAWCFAKCGGRALASLNDKERQTLQLTLANEVRLWS